MKEDFLPSPLQYVPMTYVYMLRRQMLVPYFRETITIQITTLTRLEDYKNIHESIFGILQRNKLNV